MIKAYNLKNGEKRYQFQIYIGIDPLTGKQQRTTRRGFKTKKKQN
ncbi:Arm DNA-binding domain-containing protein [Bacillus cereus]